MIKQCALAKLSYLLGKNLSAEETRQLLRKNMHGELTIPQFRPRFSILPSSQGLITSVLGILVDVQKQEAKGVETALVPILLCQASKVGDLDGLVAVMDAYPGMVNLGDYDKRVRLFFSESKGPGLTSYFGRHHCISRPRRRIRR